MSVIFTKNRLCASFLATLSAILAGWGCSSFNSNKSDAPSITPEGGSFQSNITADPVPVAAAEIATEFNVAEAEDLRPVAAKPEPQPSSQPPTEEVKTPPKAPSVPRTPGAAKPASSKKLKYVVKPGDTLMKISFHTFADVYRWREIYDANKDKVTNPNALIKGTLLTIFSDGFAIIQRNGRPYLIRRFDTLGKISKGLYGSTSYWRKLWANNRQLIHDPNRIYAGFNLYYIPQTPGPQLAPTGRLPASTQDQTGNSLNKPSP